MAKRRNPLVEDKARKLAAKHSLKGLTSQLDVLTRKGTARRKKLGDAAWEVGSAGDWYYLTDSEKDRAHLLKLAIQILEREDKAGAHDRIMARRAAKRRTKKNPGRKQGIIMGNLAEIVLRLSDGDEVTLRPKGKLLGWLPDTKQLIVLNKQRLGREKTMGGDIVSLHRKFHNAEPNSADRFEWPDKCGKKYHCGRIVSLMYTIPKWLRSPEKDRYRWDHEFGDHGERGHGPRDGRGNYPEKYMPLLRIDAKGNLFIDRAPGNKYYVSDWLYW